MGDLDGGSTLNYLDP